MALHMFINPTTYNTETEPYVNYRLWVTLTSWCRQLPLLRNDFSTTDQSKWSEGSKKCPRGHRSPLLPTRSHVQTGCIFAHQFLPASIKCTLRFWLFLAKVFLITKIPNTKFCPTHASSAVAVYLPTLYTSLGTYGLLCNKCLLGTANICVCLATISRSILMTDNNCHVHDIFRQLKIKPICSSSLKVRGEAGSFPLLSE